jgi:hypothetical protein
LQGRHTGVTSKEQAISGEFEQGDDRGVVTGISSSLVIEGGLSGKIGQEPLPRGSKRVSNGSLRFPERPHRSFQDLLSHKFLVPLFVGAEKAQHAAEHRVAGEGLVNAGAPTCSDLNQLIHSIGCWK